ncbi:MAG: AMP-binding protein [Gammaproteobacteria bacterium]
MSNALLALLEDAPSAAVAVSDGQRELSFGELLDDSARAAAGLAALGIGRGDRVAVWLPNIPAWLLVFFACARLGAIAVSVNTRFRAHEVGDIIARSGARVLVVWPDFHGIDFAGILAAVDDAALAGLEHIVTYGTADEAAAVPASALCGVPVTPYESWQALAPLAAVNGSDADRCVIFTTSGTTRAPKFVCHVQRTVAAHARDVVAALALDRPGTRVLQALPLCGVFGFTQALASLAAAAPMDMLPVFDAAAAAHCLRTHHVTHMHGVDDMIAALLDHEPQPEPFPALEFIGYAAFNPALEDIVERAAARGVTVCGLYGMSECHALFAIQPPELPPAERRKGGGRPVSPAARIRVRDAESGALLSAGDTGELEISGPSLFAEYFGDAQATAAALTDDGYLRTGDLGYLEPDGRFCYVARMGDVLRLGGFLVSPLEIESVVDAHGTVAASQVVAVTLAGRMRPVAFVLAAATEAVNEAAIIAWCGERLASYKVPARVFALDAFPATASANGTKIQKARLREMAASLSAAQ